MYGMVSPYDDIYANSGHNSPPWYGCAKAALIQFTRYTSVHLAKHDIRVNCISPELSLLMKFKNQCLSFVKGLKVKFHLKGFQSPED